jgi:hypothetical protein
MMAATEAKNKVTLDAIKKKGTAHYLFGTLKIMPEKSKENTIQRLDKQVISNHYRLHTHQVQASGAGDERKDKHASKLNSEEGKVFTRLG